MRKHKQKPKPRPKLNWRLKDKIVASIFRGQSLFIKNTGVKVSVEYFGNDSDNDWIRDKTPRDSCKITFESPPTSKALRLTYNYSIYKNGQTKSVDTNASIDLHNLSLSPFETASAKLLYDKQAR